MRNAFKSVKSLASIASVCAALFALSAAHAQPFQAHPSTQENSIKVTLETLARWETELSNWGRWDLLCEMFPGVLFEAFDQSGKIVFVESLAQCCVHFFPTK